MLYIITDDLDGKSASYISKLLTNLAISYVDLFSKGSISRYFFKVICYRHPVKKQYWV